MPRNYTPNYQLNQWEADDRVLRTDFNADNAKLDAAIKAVAARTDTLSASKADNSALAALAQTVAEERIRVGSFMGDGAKTRVVQLPWAPTFMVMFGPGNDVTSPFFLTQEHGMYVGKYGPGMDSTYVPQVRGTSLTLKGWANDSDVPSYYILFR